MYMSMGETTVSRLLLLAMSMAVVVLLAGSSPVGAFRICEHDGTNLELQCQQYVKKDGPKVAPSQACCTEVQQLDTKCVCNNLPAGIGLLISMEKAAFVARSCGKDLPAGSKCGSYVVPPALRH